MSELEAARKEIAGLKAERAQLEDQSTRFKEQSAVLEEKNARLEGMLEQMQQQLRMLLRHVFGRKSEQTPPPEGGGQLDLALEMEDAAIEAAPPAKPARRKGGSRKGRKTRAQRLPEHLPVEERVIIPLEVQAAPDRWRQIGEESSERLERHPARFVRVRLVRPVYVSKDDKQAAPFCAPLPPELDPGCFLGPGLQADIVQSKYLCHLPLYRQAKMIGWETGVELSGATLCQTVARLADAAAPVVRCMAEDLWQSSCVQMDLTPVRCLSREHDKGSFLGQMWVCAQPGGDVLYTWDKSKAALVAERIVPAWFEGVLQTDGSSETACFLRGGKARNKAPPRIIRAACWAHVRRKFHAAAEGGCEVSAKALKFINVLYRIEDAARQRGLTSAQIHALRQRRSVRVIKRLHQLLLKLRDAVRPKSNEGKACLYALGQWPGLQVFLERGDVPIDNNLVENAIRPCALGRKNWLFIGDVSAGGRAAMFYSLLGTCLRRGLNPRDYLHWLFTKLPHATNQTAHSLTPAAYSAMLAAPTAASDKAAA